MVTLDAPNEFMSLLKTLWENDKMLVTSIFSFSCNVFYPINDKSNVEIYVKFLSSANAFNSDKAKILSSGKPLNTRANNKVLYTCKITKYLYIKFGVCYTPRE